MRALYRGDKPIVEKEGKCPSCKERFAYTNEDICEVAGRWCEKFIVCPHCEFEIQILKEK